MCDPEMLSAILSSLSSYFDVLSIDSPVAISCLSVEKLGYVDEKKEKDKKDETRDEGDNKDNLQNSAEEEQKRK